MYYVDTDFFLALVKETDWMKEKAINFSRTNSLFKEKQVVTSSFALLETWFILERNKAFKREVFHAIRQIVSGIYELSTDHLEYAAYLKEAHNLNIGDAIHASFALQEDGIISSDDSFDYVAGLKRIDFLK